MDPDDEDRRLAEQVRRESLSWIPGALAILATVAVLAVAAPSVIGGGCWDSDAEQARRTDVLAALSLIGTLGLLAWPLHAWVYRVPERQGTLRLLLLAAPLGGVTAALVLRPAADWPTIAVSATGIAVVLGALVALDRQRNSTRRGH